MVYALGWTATTCPPSRRSRDSRAAALPDSDPRGRGRFPGGRFPFSPQIGFPPIGGVWGRTGNEHVNENALRSITDDTAAARRSCAASAISAPPRSGWPTN